MALWPREPIPWPKMAINNLKTKCELHNWERTLEVVCLSLGPVSHLPVLFFLLPGYALPLVWIHPAECASPFNYPTLCNCCSRVLQIPSGQSHLWKIPASRGSPGFPSPFVFKPLRIYFLARPAFIFKYFKKYFIELFQVLSEGRSFMMPDMSYCLRWKKVKIIIEREEL